MSSAGTPSFASLPRAMRMPPMTSSVLTPSRSHLPMSAAAESKSYPSWRRGAPNWTIRRMSSSTPMPVAWEARKTLSSATSWSSDATDQSPKRRMMSLVPLTRSNFVMRANLIARSVRPSRSSPVSPSPVLKAAMTVAVLPMSSRTRPATRPKLASRPSSASPVAPVPTRMASTAAL